jgi:hypothetical protein
MNNQSFESNKNSLYSKIADLNPRTRYCNSVKLSYSPNKNQDNKGYQGFINLHFYLDQNKLSDQSVRITRSEICPVIPFLSRLFAKLPVCKIASFYMILIGQFIYYYFNNFNYIFFKILIGSCTEFNSL